MLHGQDGSTASQLDTARNSPMPPDIRTILRTHLVENFLLGDEQELGDHSSLVDARVLDSTGAIEIVAFLESEFGVRVSDHAIVADNLDSIARIAAFIERKQAGRG